MSKAKKLYLRYRITDSSPSFTPLEVPAKRSFQNSSTPVARTRLLAGFTLLELLIVIAVLAILAAVTVVVLNPAELMQRTRDGRRISELSSIHRALGYFRATAPVASLGLPQRVYVSLPDTSPTCASHALPPLPTGWTYQCATTANFRNTNGTGWIPVDFTTPGVAAGFAALPIDPINNATHFYTYVTGGSWALSALFESERQQRESANRDGGFNPGKFEIGSNLNLIAQSEGLVGWWPFDEGAGTMAGDMSGNNNDGGFGGAVLPTWQGVANCRAGTCLQFNGTASRVDVLAPHINFPTSSITVSAWVNLTSHINWNDFVLNNWGVEGGWLLYSAADGAVRFGIRTTGGVAQQAVGCSAVFTLLNQWHHLVGTYDGTTVRAYVNGVQCASIASLANKALFTGGSVRFGEPETGTSHRIDDVRIYNRALSPAEISAIFNATR